MRTKLTRPSFVNYCLSCFSPCRHPRRGHWCPVDHSAWERELQTVQEQHLQIARNLVAALTRYAADVEAAFQMGAVGVI